MTDARNKYPRLCWGCLGIIEDYEHDHSLLNYGGYCTSCHEKQTGEMPGLREVLRDYTEVMNRTTDRLSLLREISIRNETNSNNPDFIIDVLRLFSLDETDCYDYLFLRCKEPGTVEFFVNVNDIFRWATADLERITPEDLPFMRQAILDVRKIAGDGSDMYEGFKLWAARKRKMRPQQPVYPGDKRLWALFDECEPAQQQ